MQNASHAAAVTAKVEPLGDDEGQMLIMPSGVGLSASEYRVDRVGASLLLTPKVTGGWEEFFGRPSRVPADFLNERGDTAPQKRGLPS
jgi:hypothetical protein